MSCFPESIYSVYVDDELSDAEKRPVEAHLIRCQACRQLILALRDEAGLLGDSLHEREPVVIRPKAAAPVRGLALGGIPTLAIIAVAAAVVGGILETRLPSYAEWLNPMRWLGAYDMAFDLVFWLRDEVPGLVEFAVAAAAIGSVAAVLSFAVSALSRRWLGTAGMLAGLLLALVLPPSARAIVVLHDIESYVVGADEVEDDSVVVMAESVRIDGIVEGDLVVFAERLIVRGEIRGNLFAGARNIELNGRVHGGMYGFSRRIHVGGQIDGNILTGSDEFMLDDGAAVGGDAVHFGESVTIQGAVARDLYGIGKWVELGGSIGRNVDVFAKRATVLGSAEIGGDFIARLPRGEEAEISPLAKIAGEARSEEIVHDHRPGFLTAAFWIAMLLHVAAAFALAAVLRMLVPTVLGATVETPGDFFRALGLGFVALVVTPFALAIIAVTVAGIPLALIGLALYLSALYIATIVVAAIIGRSFLGGAEDSDQAAAAGGASLASLLLGIVVVVAAAHLPFLGPLFGIVIILTGLGLIVQQAQASWNIGRA
jgi:cytoskeletal protein CcmA (bactofilin family)